ncbi:NUDIX domain-containing protein [Streptomyces goshikiensis]|uniref:NUDIX domain-containing protein n=1 Tax=Streptomyces goshikiensis TaxID=1942 RepID=UPI0036A919D5
MPQLTDEAVTRDAPEHTAEEAPEGPAPAAAGAAAAGVAGTAVAGASVAGAAVVGAGVAGASVAGAGAAGASVTAADAAGAAVVGAVVTGADGAAASVAGAAVVGTAVVGAGAAGAAVVGAAAAGAAVTGASVVGAAVAGAAVVGAGVVGASVTAASAAGDAVAGVGVAGAAAAVAVAGGGAVAERVGTWMSPAEYGASRAALWTGALVLVTDTDGRVLLQTVDYRPDRLMPGGAVDAGESPAAAAAREMREELGVDGHYPHGLAVDWIPADTPGFPPETRFPGEILHVYDGGTWTPDRIGAVRLPAQEITGIEFAEPADLPALMDAGDARRALSALRARVAGAGAVLLEDGRPTAPTALDRLGALRTRRVPQRAAWHPGPVPAHLPVRERSGWLFAPDGRVLLLIARATGAAHLPSPTAGPTAGALPLGYRHEAGAAGPARADARTAARLTALPPAADPAYARLLATPEQVRELCDWGPAGLRELASVHEAREHLSLPAPPRTPPVELPEDGRHF